MNKKIIVIALLASQFSSMGYAGSAPSLTAVVSALQNIRASADTWKSITNSNNGIGPSYEYDALQTGSLTGPLAYPAYALAWIRILNATNLWSLIGFPSSTLLSSFYAVELSPTSTSSPNGPTIDYEGTAGSYSVCALYDANGNYMAPTASVSGNFFYTQPRQVASGTSLAYSSSQLFHDGVLAAAGATYYMVCAAYTLSGSQATGIPTKVHDFTITWS